MMPYIWELSIWDLLTVNQLRLSLTQVVNTSLSPVLSAMIKLPVTSNLRNTIRSLDLSCKEINLMIGVRLSLTICINQILIKFYLKHPPSLLTDLPNYKDSSGKITLASSH
jgi:hypothetical protein